MEKGKDGGKERGRKGTSLERNVEWRERKIKYNEGTLTPRLVNTPEINLEKY